MEHVGHFLSQRVFFSLQRRQACGCVCPALVFNSSQSPLQDLRTRQRRPAEQHTFSLLLPCRCADAGSLSLRACPLARDRGGMPSAGSEHHQLGFCSCRSKCKCKASLGLGIVPRWTTNSVCVTGRDRRFASGRTYARGGRIGGMWLMKNERGSRTRIAPGRSGQLLK